MTPKSLSCRLGLAGALFALFVAGCASSDRERSQPWGRNLRAVDGGNRGRQRVVDAAIANAKDAETPKILPETHFAAGRLFETQGQFEKAVHQYRKAVAVNHHFTEAYHRLGLTLSRTGKHDEAAQALRRAVELQPDRAQLRNDLGFELLLCREWPEAEVQLVHAINLRPDFPRAYVNLGIVQSKRGRFSEALATFRTVLPEADAYYNLGLMYRGQRRLDEAVAAFRHVLAIDPKFTAANKQLDQIVAQYQPSSPLDRKLSVEGGTAGPKRETRRANRGALPAGLRDSDVAAPGLATDPTGQVGTAPNDADSWDRAIEALNTMMKTEDPKTDVPETRNAPSGSAVSVSNLASRAETSAGSSDSEAEFGSVNPPTECWALDGPVCPADDSFTYLQAPAEAQSAPGVCRADRRTPRYAQPPPSFDHVPTPYLLAGNQVNDEVSCVDRRALLRELGEALSVVRNQIECLESSVEGGPTRYAVVDALRRQARARHAMELEADRDPLMGPPAPDAWRGPFDTWGLLGWPVPSRAQLAADMLPPQRGSTDAVNAPENSQQPKKR